MTAAPQAPRRKPKPEFVTPAEAAAALRVSKMTIYREIEHGHLRAIRVGRSFRIFYSALDEYVHNAEVGFDWHIA